MKIAEILNWVHQKLIQNQQFYFFYAGLKRSGVDNHIDGPAKVAHFKTD